MAETGSKSYKDTSPFGTDVDLTGERELAAARAYKHHADSDEFAAGRSAAGEGEADDVDEGTRLYDLRQDQGRGGSDGMRLAVRRARSRMSRLTEDRPLQLLFGAALAGFLFGRFG